MSNKNTKIILFGINGDLSKRKLLPALNNIISNNIVNNITQIIGVGRSSFVPEQLLNSVFANNENNLSKILECFSYKDPNTQTIEDFINLKEKVNLQDDEQLIIFLSL
jgi:glucose-6-phosphate 1-dehydrogenase